MVFPHNISLASTANARCRRSSPCWCLSAMLHDVVSFPVYQFLLCSHLTNQWQERIGAGQRLRPEKSQRSRSMALAKWIAASGDENVSRTAKNNRRTNSIALWMRETHWNMASCFRMYIDVILVSAPLNPIPTAEYFRRSHPQCEHSYGQHIYMSEENNVK